MRWVVVGASGMLGRDLVDCLRAAEQPVLAVGHGELDILDEPDVRAAVLGSDVVVNCAAYTNVDGAESDEAAAFAVNAVGAQNIARAAAREGARLVHLSTDYVFSGDVPEPLSAVPYAEDDPLAPRSAYGRSKAAGEWAVRAEHEEALILRTAWLYGAHGRCFPRTIAQAAATRPHLDVVDDQWGQPTWTVDVADVVARLVAAGAPAGTYHATSSGRASWWELARAVVAEAGHDMDMVRRCSSADFPRPAPRPAFSVLGHDALRAVGIAPIGDWRDRWAVAAPTVLQGI